MIGTNLNIANSTKGGASLGGLDPDWKLLHDEILNQGGFIGENENAASNALYIALKGASVNFFTDYLDAGYLFIGYNLGGGLLEMKLAFNGYGISGLGDDNFSKFGFFRNSDGITDADHDMGTNFNYFARGISADDCGLSYGLFNILDTTDYTPTGAQDATALRIRIREAVSLQNSRLQVGNASSEAVYNNGTNNVFFGRKVGMRTSTLKYYIDGDLKSEYLTPSGDMCNAEMHIGAFNNENVDVEGLTGYLTYVMYFKKAMTDALVVEFDGIMKDWELGMQRYIEPDLYPYFDSLGAGRDPVHLTTISRAYLESGLTPAVFSKVKRLYLPNGDNDKSLVDITGNEDATRIGGIETYPQGFNTNDRTKALSTGFIVGTDSPNNAVTFGAYVNEADITNFNAVLLGVSDPSPSRVFRYQGAGIGFGQLRFQHDNGLADAVLTKASQAKGMQITGLHSANGVFFIVNGETLAHTGSIGLNAGANTFDVFMGGQNSAGTIFAGLENTFRCGFIGVDLTEDEAKIVGDFIERYLYLNGLSLVSPMSNHADVYLNKIGDNSIYLPAMERRAKINLINSLDTGGIWDSADVIQVFATLEESDGNISLDLKRLLNGTVIGNINRDALGIKGNGVDMVFNTLFNPRIISENITLTNASYNAYVVEVDTTNGFYLGGQSGNNSLALWRSGANIVESKVHQNPYAISSVLDSEFPILLSAVRENNEDSILEVDGVERNRDAIPATQTPLEQITVMARRQSAAEDVFSDAKIALVVFGSNSINRVLLWSLSQRYLRALKGYRS